MNDLLLNKYKPYSIDQFMLPESLKLTMNNMMKIDEISIILHGAHGAGKTAIANCILQEYFATVDANIVKDNVLFVSGFNDQGINFYRNEMKVFCQSQCTVRNKKKMVVFDDIDHIGDQNQHIFRHYIDNYRNKIGFIMTSTQLHKVIDSIQSRLMVIYLPKPPKEKVLEKCIEIARAENITIAPSTIQSLIPITNNTISYLLNYLEKIRLMNSDMNETNIKHFLTHIDMNLFDTYFDHIQNEKFYDAVHILYHLHDTGFSVIDILHTLINYLKTTTQLEDVEKYKIIPLVCKYITVFYDIHEDPINLTFITNNIMNIFK